MDCGAAVLMLIGLPIAVAALLLASRAEQRVKRIEGEVSRLRDLLARRATESSPPPVDPAGDEAAATAEARAPAPPAPPPVAASTPPTPGVASEDAPASRPPLPPPPLEPHAPAAASPPAVAASGRPHPDSFFVNSSGDEKPREPRFALPASGEIDWERWIGIRGAALVGGVVLALAALLFLKYAIDQGFFPPPVRVVLAAAAGVTTLVVSEVLRRRGYARTGDPLAGAGIVTLYGAVWAGHRLYELLPQLPAFLLLAAITALCAWLSWRHRSLVIAVLGLAGGFSTPLILASLRHQPLSLFGYLLVLDIGLLGLARSRRWPSLAALGLLLTTLYQVAWLGGGLGEIELGLGLAVLGLFAAAFVVLPQLGGPAEASRPAPLWSSWQGVQASAVLLPFMLALRFAADADLAPRLYPIALFLLPLTLAALWLSRRHGEPLLALGAAGGALGVISVWALRADPSTGEAWEIVASLLGLAVVHQLFFERGRDGVQPATAFALGSLALAALLPLAHTRVELWPWLFTWLVLAALLLLQRQLGAPPPLAVVVPALVALGFTAYLFPTARWSAPGAEPWLVFVSQLTVGAALLAWGWLQDARRGELDDEAVTADGDRSPLADRLTPLGGAYAFALIATLTTLLALFDTDLATLPGLATLSVCGALGVLAATRMLSGSAYASVVAALAFTHSLWALAQIGAESPRNPLALVFAGQWLTVAVLTLWPAFAGVAMRGSEAARARASRTMMRGGALAAPLFFPSLWLLFDARFDDELLGLLPLGLALLGFAAWLLTRRSPDDPHGAGGRWPASAALGFVGVAVPMQFDGPWLTVGWGVYALALLALGIRRRSGALRWASLGLLVITIAKVFLYDLGELEDLYRVASLIGLAASLILVSLVYQRFVFGRSEDGSGSERPGLVD